MRLTTTALTRAAAAAGAALALTAAAPPAITVTAPAGGGRHAVNGSVTVRWTNNSGAQVGIWLDLRSPGGPPERVVRLATKAGRAPAGELAVTVPDVPDGDAYVVEVAAEDGRARGFSGAVTITSDPAGTRRPGSA